MTVIFTAVRRGPRAAWVECDFCGKVNEKIPGGPGGPPQTVDDIRLAAMTAGWIQQADEDVCPECKASGRNVKVTGSGS